MKKKIQSFDIFLLIILTLWGLIIIFPFYNAILISLVSQTTYIKTPFMIWPKEITFDAYKYLLDGELIFSGYKNTLLIVLIGVPYNLLLTTGVAYAMSRPNFLGKKVINVLIIFTMYFGGGIIPFYLLVRSLNLNNTLGAVILTYGVNTFYMIIMRKFFDTIPEALVESAKIDGANDIFILYKIILPLSMPIIATLVLFYSVDRWNEWFNAMLFLRSQGKWPLQLVLRSIVYSTIDTAGSQYSPIRQTVFTEGVKMASVIVTMLPIMIFYPFLQKYFMKGIMIGAVKA